MSDPFAHSLNLKHGTRDMLKRLAAVLILAVVVAPDAHAQIRASERGAVSQTIDGTTITVDHGRPQARGRTDLWGGVTPWGKVWTPGANWATTIETNRDITINGHDLAAGKYSVWFEVQPEEWTVILDPQARRFHLMPPEPSENQVRFPIRPGTGPYVEVLTWSFPAVKPTGGSIQMAWGEATATLDIGVHPSQPITVTADFAERFVGSYQLSLEEPLGGQTVNFEITYENEVLVAHWDNPPLPRLAVLWLAPLGAGMFNIVELEQGEIFDIVQDVVLEFTPLDGQANKFELRVIGDLMWGSAVRTQ
jgi:hypothetical protein